MAPCTRALPLLAALCVFALGAAAPGASEADPARGQLVWRKCQNCHTTELGGRNRTGPRLAGIFSRPAGSLPNYRYSEALKRSGIVWAEGTLDTYLKDSEAFVPGTKMYGGLSLARDRADLIAYLKAATRAPPVPSR